METTDFKYKEGITLISLVVTIIILLILVGVSISILTGILTQTAKSKEQTEMAIEREQIQLAYIEGLATKSEITSIKDNLINNLKNNKINTEVIYGNDDSGFVLILDNKNVYEIDTSGKVEYKGLRVALSDATPELMARSDNYAFWQSEYITKITKIEIKPYIAKLDNVLEEWPLSIKVDPITNQRETSVMGYLLSDGNDRYKLYIMLCEVKYYEK